MGEKVYVGWKEIAARLEVNERTARRWARKKGLPVKVRVDVIRMTETDFLAWLVRIEVAYPAYAEEKQRRPKSVLQAA